MPSVAVSGRTVYIAWESFSIGPSGNGLATSSNRGITFGPPASLAFSKGQPGIAASGDKVYLVWDGIQQNAAVSFSLSTDKGATFGSAIEIGNPAGFINEPNVAVSGDDVYVVWGGAPPEGGAYEVHFARSTDGGLTFGAPRNLSGAPGAFPSVAASGDNVYVLWNDGGIQKTTLMKSTNNGNTFAEISHPVPSTTRISLAASGSKVYVAWHIGSSTASRFLAISNDGGGTFGATIDLSGSIGESIFSDAPSIAASNGDVYFTWGGGGNGVKLIAAVGPNRPVVFVPGISGSVLIDPMAGDREIWIRNLVDWPDLSLFPSDGPILIRASDALRVAQVALPVVGVVGSEPIYGPFLQRMADEGFHEYELADDGTFIEERLSLSGCDLSQADDPGPKPDLFIFPYDWRKDNGQNADLLWEYVRCVREFYAPADTEVSIVAHSMGSLLSRRYILDNPGDHHVKALITIGGPFLGAPKLIYVLETGHFLDPPVSLLPTVNSTFKHLTRSFPGAHQLLPSRKYFEIAAEVAAAHVLVEDDRDLNFDGTFKALSYSEMTGVVDLLYGQEGFSPGSTSDAFHQGGQDDWRGDTSGVTYSHIVGKQAGETTIGGGGGGHLGVVLPAFNT